MDDYYENDNDGVGNIYMIYDQHNDSNKIGKSNDTYNGINQV